MRGDQDVSAGIGDGCGGTPPRAWGSANLLPRHHLRRRDTPTCVGISEDTGANPNADSGHPHVRGDQLGVVRIPVFHDGTPPRAWGSAHQPVDPGLVARDTPTCVGIRPDHHVGVHIVGGHPHVRGDQQVPGDRFPLETGTPPRAWGSVDCSSSTRSLRRDTPTCVGISFAVGKSCTN